MTTAAFDTLATANRLHEELDVPRKQAEGVVRVVHGNLVGTVATKADLAALEDSIKAEIKAEISVAKFDLFKWMVALNLGMAAVLVILLWRPLP